MGTSNLLEEAIIFLYKEYSYRYSIEVIVRTGVVEAALTTRPPLLRNSRIYSMLSSSSFPRACMQRNFFTWTCGLPCTGIMGSGRCWVLQQMLRCQMWRRSWKDYGFLIQEIIVCPCYNVQKRPGALVIGLKPRDIQYMKNIAHLHQGKGVPSNANSIRSNISFLMEWRNPLLGFYCCMYSWERFTAVFFFVTGTKSDGKSRILQLSP